MTPADSIEALHHLLKPVPEAPVVLWHDGKRYSGFVDANHAAFVARHLGWERFEMEFATCEPNASKA